MTEPIKPANLNPNLSADSGHGSIPDPQNDKHEPTQKVFSDAFLLPNDATRIHGKLWYQDHDGTRSVFNGLDPFLTYTIDDVWLHRFCAAQLAEAGLAPIGHIARAMGISISTLRRDRIRLVQNGFLEFPSSGREGRTKATPTVCDTINRMFQLGRSKRSIADTLGISEGTVRSVLKEQIDNAPTKTPQRAQQSLSFDDPQHPGQCDSQSTVSMSSTPSHAEATEEQPHEQISEEDAISATPAQASTDDLKQDQQQDSTYTPLNEVVATSIPYATPVEQFLTSLGRIEEAPIDFQDARQVPCAGALLGLALLPITGLMQESRAVYGRLKNCWYGLRPLLWTLTLMALLRIKRPENMKEYDPAALGALTGLPRGPEVKTIRRKLSEVAGLGKAAELHRALARRRAERYHDVIGTLYVDGHIRDYYGKRKIGRRFLTRKNGTEHGVMDGWVHTEDGQPLFVLHAARDESLTQLFPQLLSEIREVVGDDRRVCLVFDRECWSHKLFWKILDAGFDFMTYRKAPYELIDDAEFAEVKATIDGHEVKYDLAETTFEKENWPVLRLIGVKRNDGGQTQIVASGQQTWLSIGKAAGVDDAAAAQKCFRMFGRWSQENWLKYAKEQFALDVLVDYQTELDDADRLVPNAEWNRRDRAVRSAREKWGLSKEHYATEVLKADDEQDAEKRASLLEASRSAESAYEAAKAQRSEVPKTIRSGDCDGRDAIKMSYERKLFSDTVKLCAYDIETMLVNLLPARFRKTDHESRTLVRDYLQSVGDITVDGDRLRVSLNQRSAPRYTEGLIALCSELNQLCPTLPESNLRLEFFVNPRPVG